MTITLLTELARATRWARPPADAVWLDPNKTSPFEFYQYWRNVGDADVLKCIRMLTFLPLEQINEMDTWADSQAQRGQGNSRLRADQDGSRRGRGRKGQSCCQGAVCGRRRRRQHAHHGNFRRQAGGRQDRHSEPDGGLRTGALQQARRGSWWSRAAFWSTTRRCPMPSSP